MAGLPLQLVHAALFGICLNMLKSSTAIATVATRVLFCNNKNKLRFPTAGGLRWKSGYRQAPMLTAAPVRALIDEPISIKGRFLHPHFPVTAYIQMHSEDGDLWEAFAHYNTDADGTVNCELS